MPWASIAIGVIPSTAHACSTPTPRLAFSTHLDPVLWLLVLLITLRAGVLLYGFGTCSVFETIQHPCAKNRPTIGCTSNIVPCITVPNGISACVQPRETQNAMRPAMPKLVGIGRPSKYFALPLASLGTFPVVTLKRANLARPARTKQVRRSWSRGVRKPTAKAHIAGATPKEICTCCQQRTSLPSSVKQTYQIRQRIKLLPHQAALVPPSRDLAIEEIEEQPKRHERQRHPYVGRLVRRAHAVAHRGEDGHDAAEAVHERDEISEVVGAYHAEVAGFWVVEETGLLVLCCGLSAIHGL